MDMLELYVAPQLEESQPWIIFQQDFAPLHWVWDVRRCLDATFSNGWIGRDGPIPWPPRSPDITPLDFFLWGYVKNKVFSKPVPDITRVGTLIVATIYLQLIQNRYMFRSFTVLHCSHQHCVQPVASDVEVVGYL